jgi:hypothetical protein
MAGPPNAHNRLSRSAKEAFDLRGLDLARSAQDAVGDLVSRAAEVMEGGDEGELRRAEESFRRLAVEVAAEQAIERRSARRSSPRVGRREIDAALRGLCPGFWPFC